jgi:hypothetical protein
MTRIGSIKCAEQGMGEMVLHREERGLSVGQCSGSFLKVNVRRKNQNTVHLQFPNICKFVILLNLLTYLPTQMKLGISFFGCETLL